MRLSIPIVAQHQWEDAMLEALNDAESSFVWVSFPLNADGTLALFAYQRRHCIVEPGRKAAMVH